MHDMDISMDVSGYIHAYYLQSMCPYVYIDGNISMEVSMDIGSWGGESNREVVSCVEYNRHRYDNRHRYWNDVLCVLWFSVV